MRTNSLRPLVLAALFAALPAVAADSTDAVLAAYRDFQYSIQNQQAANAAQGTSIRFESKRPVFETAGYRYWFDLKGFGEARSLQSTGRRAEYRHDGVTEWYLNAPEGIEQGFTVE